MSSVCFSQAVGGSLIKCQRGVVLFIALIALVIMSMVGISMVRQMTGGQQIVGNLGLKHGTTSVADRATELGRAFVTGSASAILDANVIGNGYYASAPDLVNPATPFDPIAHDWTNASASVIDDGNTVNYVVHRLCNDVGVFEEQDCVARETSEGGEKSCTPPACPPKQLQPYYRITTRVTGPRNAISYTQVFMY